MECDKFIVWNTGRIDFDGELNCIDCILIQVAGGNGGGSTSDKLSGPWGVYVDASSSVYVVDRNNHRIQRWDLG